MLDPELAGAARTETMKEALSKEHHSDLARKLQAPMDCNAISPMGVTKVFINMHWTRPSILHVEIERLAETRGNDYPAYPANLCSVHSFYKQIGGLISDPVLK